MATACLDTLVGLTDKDCDCFSSGRPATYNTSDSGYYLTDHEYGFPMQEAVFNHTDCADDIWTKMEAAKDKAVEIVKSDLRRGLVGSRSSRVGSWKGSVGKTKQDAYENTVYDTLGLQMAPKRLRDASFVITAIRIGLNESKTFNLTIRSNDPDFSTITQSITSVAGQWTTITPGSAITLPLFSEVENELYYFFEYAPGTARPFNNELMCGCSGEGWKKYMRFGSYGVNSGSTFDNYGIYTGQAAYGLILEGYVDCAQLDWMCRLEQMNGYNVRDVIARCIQFKGAIQLIMGVVESGRVSKYSVLADEGLIAKAQHLQSLYEQNIAWVVQNLPDNLSACFGCHKGQPEVAAILV